jgi:hypothetical protein
MKVAGSQSFYSLATIRVKLTTSSVTKSLAVGAILFGGLLAGVTADRALVQMPAWERIGVIPWGTSRGRKIMGLDRFSI